MTYRVLYTEQFHEELGAQLTYFAQQGAPETRVDRREVLLLGFRHGARRRGTE